MNPKVEDMCRGRSFTVKTRPCVVTVYIIQSIYLALKMHVFISEVMRIIATVSSTGLYWIELTPPYCCHWQLSKDRTSIAIRKLW